MERIVNTVEEKLDRETIIKGWKGYTTDDAIVVIEKAMKAIKPETINSCQKNCVQMLCMTA